MRRLLLSLMVICPALGAGSALAADSAATASPPAAFETTIGPAAEKLRGVHLEYADTAEAQHKAAIDAAAKEKAQAETRARRSVSGAFAPAHVAPEQKGAARAGSNKPFTVVPVPQPRPAAKAAPREETHAARRGPAPGVGPFRRQRNSFTPPPSRVPTIEERDRSRTTDRFPR